MVSDIDVIETIEDKKSWFNIKRFRIGTVDFSNPCKSLDLKNLDRPNFLALRDGFKFFEASKVIKNSANLLSLYNEDNTQRINNFYYRREWFSNVPNVVNFTFEFNPFSIVNSIDKLSWFFDQYYPYSKLMLTIPNIRLRKTLNGQTVEIINIENYKRFVDDSFEVLNNKNNKPIFVPVSMRMSQGKLTELIAHYLKKEYYCYWFDFEGQPINESNLGRLRHVYNTLKQTEAFNRVVSYFTNIRREKLSNSNEETSVASDALCSIAGANLIGVNREPQRYFKPPIGQQDTVRTPTAVDPSHKARIFDRESYYYIKTYDPDLFPKNRYVPVNAARLNAEFNAQSEYFLIHQNLETLLYQKRMFKDEKAGNMLKELTSKSTGVFHSLSDYFG